MGNSEKNKKAKKAKKVKRKEKHTKSKWSLKKPMYIDKKDKRYKKHMKQLKEYGFSDTETWALDSVIAEFILPRLKAFKRVTIAFPPDITFKEWKKKIDKMIFAFEWALEYENDWNCNLSKEQSAKNWKKYKKGMRLFSDEFMSLWW